MSEVAVSALPVATAIASEDDLLVVQGGVTKQFPRSLLKRSGWEQYTDAAVTAVAGQNITAGSSATLQIDGDSSNVSQTPVDATSPLWDTVTNKFMPIASGDAYDLRVNLHAENYSGPSPYIDIELDIGGALGVIASVTVPLLKAGDEGKIMVPFPVFALATFVANGGFFRIKYEGSGSVDIHAASIVIIRTHSAL